MTLRKYFRERLRDYRNRKEMQSPFLATLFGKDLRFPVQLLEHMYQKRPNKKKRILPA